MAGSDHDNWSVHTEADWHWRWFFQFASLSIFHLSIFDLSIFHLLIFHLSIFDLSIFDLSIFNLSIFNLSIFDLSIFSIFKKDWLWSNRSRQSFKQIDRDRITLVDLWKNWKDWIALVDLLNRSNCSLPPLKKSKN